MDTPALQFKSLRASSAPLTRPARKRYYLAGSPIKGLSFVGIAFILYLGTGTILELSHLHPRLELVDYVSTVIFIFVAAFPLFLFFLGLRGEISPRNYVSLFSPAARFWYAVGVTLLILKSFEFFLFPILPHSSSPLSLWMIPIGSVALLYYAPSLLSKNKRTLPERISTDFGLYIGTSSGALGAVSHGAAMASGQHITLTLEDAAQNIIVFGGIGSGKTTRAVQPLLSQLLEQDSGGLIFDIKGDFKKAVLVLASQVNREVTQIGPNQSTMNLLSGLTPEVASSFLKSAFLLNSSGHHDSFWIDTATELSKNALGVLSFFPEHYTLSGLYSYLYDASIREDIDEAVSTLLASSELSEKDSRLLKTYQGYHDSIFGKFDDKVQSGVNATVAQVLSPFNHPELVDAFCTENENAPRMESVLDDAVFLVDMPLSIWGLGGKVAYNFIKLRFFNVMQRRTAEASWNQNRPVFFMCDEFQEIVSANREGLSDLNFWDKSRSSKCIGIISAQGVSSFYAAIGNHDIANTLIQNFRQKLSFRTEDKTTIELLNHLLGRVDIQRVSRTEGTTKSSSTGWGEKTSTSQSTSVSDYERQVLNPQLFRQLGPNQAVALLSISGVAMDDVIAAVPLFVN